MDKKLRQELLKMLKADQESIYGDINRHNQIRIENTERFEEITKRVGWPSSNIVGKKGELAAWLIVQHADHYPKFQEKCLYLLTKLTKTNERKKHVAYLTDRVLVNNHKKKLYGTQFYEVKGKSTPRPLQDPKNLEKRRKEMGLESFEKYKKSLLQFSKEFDKKRHQQKS